MIERINLEDIAVIVVLGLIAGIAEFTAIPHENTLIVTSIASGLVGWLARGLKQTVTKDDPAPGTVTVTPPATVTTPTDEFSIPPKV